MSKKQRITSQVADLTNTITECIKELEDRQIGRVVISAKQFQGESDGGWVENERKAYYHPDTLPQSEAEVAKQGKNYQTIAIINGYEPRVVKRAPGQYMFEERTEKEGTIEVVTRNKTHTMTIDDFENNNFINEWSQIPTYHKEAMEQIVSYFLEEGVNSEEFRRLFDKGVAEYHAKTIEMMDEVGATASSAKAQYIAPRPNIIDKIKFYESDVPNMNKQAADRISQALKQSDNNKEFKEFIDGIEEQ